MMVDEQEREERGAERPGYHEILHKHMQAAGIKDVDEVYERFEERSRFVFDREAFQMMYEGTWPFSDPKFSIGFGVEAEVFSEVYVQDDEDVGGDYLPLL